MKRMFASRSPLCTTWMILFTMVVLSGTEEGRAQGIPCDDYAAGGVVPFARWDFQHCIAGGTARYRIFRSTSDDGCTHGAGSSLYDAADPLHPVLLREYSQTSDDCVSMPYCELNHMTGNRFVLFESPGTSPVTVRIVDISPEGINEYQLSYTDDFEGNDRFAWWTEYWATEVHLLDTTDLNAVEELDLPLGMVMPDFVFDVLAIQHVGDVWTVVDLVGPGGAALRGSFNMPDHEIAAKQLVDRVLFIVTYQDNDWRLWSLDLSDLDHPVILESLIGFPSIRGFTVRDGLLHSFSDDGIRTYDVSDPSQIIALCDPFGIGENCIQVLPRGNLLYARFDYSFAVFDITDPTAPALLGTVPLGGTELISCYRLDLIDAEHWLISGEHFLHFDCNDPLPLDDGGQPIELPVASPLSITASQALQRASEIRFSLDRPGAADLSVYDLQGRRIAMLVSEVLPAGSHIVTWDGRDGSGRTQPAGVYLARLRLDDRTATCKLTLIK